MNKYVNLLVKNKNKTKKIINKNKPKYKNKI